MELRIGRGSQGTWGSATIGVGGAKREAGHPDVCRLQISTPHSTRTVTLEAGESVDVPGEGVIRLVRVEEPPTSDGRVAPGSGAVVLEATGGDS